MKRKKRKVPKQRPKVGSKQDPHYHLLRSHHLALLIILIITALTFLNTFQNDFVWDDHVFIENWVLIQSPNHIPELLMGAQPDIHTGSYRPITSLYYVLSYQLWGKTPFGYHLQSLILHLLATALVYGIILKLSNQRIALTTSLLFGLHPMHTEVINFMTSTYDLAAVLLLGAFYAYLLASTRGYTLSIILATLAFFTYELTLIFPLLILLYHLTLGKKPKGKNSKHIINLVTRTAPFFIAVATTLLIRHLLNIGFRGAYLGGSFALNMLTSIKAVLKYITLTIIPYPLNVNHTLSEGILSIKRDSITQAVQQQTLFQPQILLAILTIATICYLAYYLRTTHPIVTFSIGWFFIALLPALNFVPNFFQFAERYAYIAILGFALIIAYLLDQLYTKKEYRNLVIILLISISAAYIAIDVQRNTHWNNDITLWENTIKHSPNSAYAYQSLAETYKQQDNIHQAAHYLQQGLQQQPTNVYLLNALAVLAQQQGSTAEAAELYQQAIQIDPEFPQALLNLGGIYHLNGDLDNAIVLYTQALQARPDYPQALLNLGSAYQMKGDSENALKHYNLIITKALNANDELARAHLSKGMLLGAPEDLPNYQQALSLGLPEAAVQLGIYYTKQNNPNKAKEYFTLALQMDPGNPVAVEYLSQG